MATCSEFIVHISRVTRAPNISQMIWSGGISNRNRKITAITRISANFKLLQVYLQLSCSKYRSHSAGTVLWLIFWWAGTFSSNSHSRSLYTGPSNALYSLSTPSCDCTSILKRFYAFFYPCAYWFLASSTRYRLNRRQLNTYRETRPPSWTNGTWQVPSQLPHSGDSRMTSVCCTNDIKYHSIALHVDI